VKLATRDNGMPDGELILVSSEGSRALAAGGRFPNLLVALDDWPAAEAGLRAIAARLEVGEGETFDPAVLRAPLPRSWQWLDGSAFPAHAELMRIAFGTDPIQSERPLMYQGLSDRFYGPFDSIPFPDEAHGIDFEGEYGVIVDAVPMGTDAITALGHIRLVVQINDWSLRALAGAEMKTGFGWIQAKPACSMAPFAVTPDTLGDGWRDGRVCLDLAIDWNGVPFGQANGREMQFGFHELIAHAAATRDLVAGTIIGSGTVANAGYQAIGSSCIAERRAIEMIAGGVARTEFMRFGDRVAMEARDADGGRPFGRIEQMVIAAGALGSR
jgi:fumarylacetoacetate (FAA) hydrolase